MLLRYRLEMARLLAVLVLTASTLFSQASTGSIAGQITDQTRAAVPGATVTLTNEGTGAERTATADNTGAYIFPLVAPGRYRLRANAAGFKTYEVTGLEVQVAQQITENLQLEVGDTATKLEVAAVAPVLEQRSAEIGQVIGQNEVVALPLNGRNFLDLAKLVPGVAELPGTSQSNGLAINGQRANQIGFIFDGVDTRTETSGKPAFSPSIEAILGFLILKSLCL